MAQTSAKIVDSVHKALAASLAPGETVLTAIKGANLEGEYVAATDHGRVIVLKKATTARWGKRIAVFDGRNITSIQLHTGVLNGCLVVHAPGYENVKKHEHAKKADNAIHVERPYEPAQKLVSEIQALIARTHAGSPHAAAEHPSPREAATGDIPDQIRKLAELRDAGILDSEEFEAKKRELIARM